MTHALVEQLTAELTDALRAAGDPVRAEGEAAYLKSDLAFFGVRLPFVRAAVRSTYASVHDRDEALALAIALWNAVPAVFELRNAAVMVLVEAMPLLTRADLELVAQLVHGSHTWALVDPLSCDVTGPLIDRLERDGADLTPVLDGWADDDDFWLRRGALLAHLRPLSRGRARARGQAAARGQAGTPEVAGDWPRFARYADTMLAEKEFFIRKAIGWVLRDTSKQHPDLVRAWVEPRLDRMSGVTRREAVKYL